MDGKYRKEIKLGRHKISYFQKGRGPVLILLHNAINSAYSFRHIFETLALTGRVIAPDLPGTGQSFKSLKFNYGLDSMADLLDEFMAELKIKQAVIAGSSTGAAIAQKFALNHPEKIIKLILIDSYGLKLRKNQTVLDLGSGRAILNGLSTPARVMEFYLGQFHCEDTVKMEDRMLFLDTTLKKSVPECIHQFLKENGNFEIEGISKIDKPTLIIWGERDKILPKSMAEKFVKKIPNSRYVMIPEAGHLPHEESPEDFTTVVLDFLRDGIPYHK